MKKLLIVDDRRPLWTEIALTLAEVDALVKIITVENAGRILAAQKPHMMVLGEESRRLLSAASGDMIQLIISGTAPAEKIVRSREGRNIVYLGWPAEKEFLLEVTGRMLSVDCRWPFKTPVSITSMRGEWEHGGESKDFSLSGMAFTSTTGLEKHDEIEISFDSGKSALDLCLDARVVRHVPDHNSGPPLYGVVYKRLSSGMSSLLERFVGDLRRCSP